MRSILGVLIQIPFFIGAYQFLTHYDAFKGVSFIIFHDLSLPDGLLGLNIMPIIMTVVNMSAGVVYGLGDKKAFMKRGVMQIVLIPSIFLVVLYDKPSALLIYWTMNNLFSLCKNIIQKRSELQSVWYQVRTNKGDIHIRIKNTYSAILFHPRQADIVFNVLLLNTLLTMVYVIVYVTPILNDSQHRVLALVLIGTWGLLFVYVSFRFIVEYLRNKHENQKQLFNLREKIALFYTIVFLHIIFIVGIFYAFKIQLFSFPLLSRHLLLFLPCIGTWLIVLFTNNKQNFFTFVLQGFSHTAKNYNKKELHILMVSTLGLLIVSLFVNGMGIYFSSPGDFVITFGNLMFRMLSMLVVVSLGIFVIYLCLKKLRVLICSLCFVGIMIIFIYSLIPLDSGLILNVGGFGNPELLNPTATQTIVDLGLLILFIVGIYILYLRTQILSRMRLLSILNIALIIAMMVQGVNAYRQVDKKLFYQVPTYQVKNIEFSRGKNIFLIYLDGFPNYMMNEVLRKNPEMKEQLDGFIWYKNTVSAGSYTWNGSPGVLGGEGYTLDNMMEDGLTGDGKEILDSYLQATLDVEDKFIDKVKTHNAEVMLYGDKTIRLLNHISNDNTSHYADLTPPNTSYPMFYFPDLLLRITLLRFIPFSLRMNLYDDGKWFMDIPKDTWRVKQEYDRMQKLKRFEIVGSKNTRVNAIISQITHCPYGINEQGNFSIDTLRSKYQYWHYEGQYYTDVFVMNEIINFINRVKEEGIYDDMQIVIVSDHGNLASYCDKLIEKDERNFFEKYSEGSEMCWYDSILLVKDFNSRGVLREDNETFLGNFDSYPIMMHSLDNSIPDPRESDTTNRSIIHTAHFGTGPPWLVTQIRMIGSALDTSKWEIIRDEHYQYRESKK